jgi:uncharacterized membrane protein YidH (DUF202 family)
MSDSKRVADPGMQLERTALAWHRTALPIAVDGILVFNMTADVGLVAIIAAGVAFLAATALWWLPARAYRKVCGTTAGSVVGRVPIRLTAAAAFGLTVVEGIIIALR